MFDREQEMALESMQRNQTSSRVYLGYMELFGVAGVASVSL